MVENVKRRKTPIPIPPKVAYGWAEELYLPRGGETILYTGLLYQMAPYIDALVYQLSKIEEGKEFILKIGRVASKFFDITKVASKVSDEQITRQNNILKNISKLLLKADVEFGYLYEDELYSGVLLYDLGVDKVFKWYIKDVYNVFRKYGVKRIITVDPHTTHILRSIYPKYIPEYNIKVENYLEILLHKNLKAVNNVNKRIVIHDPCFYARYEKIIDEPRKLLNKIGVTIEEPKNSREYTFCCGGPIESVSPKLSSEVAKLRFNQLIEKSSIIVVMCPLCYLNLRRVADKGAIIDISELLSQGYLP